MLEGKKGKGRQNEGGLRGQGTSWPNISTLGSQLGEKTFSVYTT